MCEYSNANMMIDLAANVYIDNLADSGEVSISMCMVEISLQCQEKALKTTRFARIAFLC